MGQEAYCDNKASTVMLLRPSSDNVIKIMQLDIKCLVDLLVDD